VTLARLLSILLGATLLAACVTVDIGPADVLVTNRDVARDNLKLAGQPASQARLGSSYGVENGDLPAVFGSVHYALVRGAAGRPLIVFCGGNAFREEYGGRARAEALSPYGDVLMFDYPGSGQSGGVGTVRDFEATGEAVLAKARAELATRGGDRIIFWGHSLGAGVCAGLAARSQVPSVLVMEAGFANYDDVAKAVAGPLAPMVRTRVEPETLQNDIQALLAGYDQPIILIASRTDETIPFGATRRLAERLRAAGRKLDFVILPRGKHSSFYRDPDYGPPVRAALARIGITLPAER
jgi:pimeloyl-ACP methyl ester carboxylesterase